MFWGFDIYIYAYIFHNIWEVFDARKFETKEPSKKMVLKLEPETKLFRAAALRPAAVTSGFT